MKKIILLFFTFSGICSCFSQNLPRKTDGIIATQHPVANILPLKTDSIKAKEKSSAHIYPNPAKNKVEIEIKGFEPGYVNLQLLNSTGKLKREEKRLVLTGNETIIFMFLETPGLYYLLLKQGTQTVKSKLIIQ
jgi:hypothetical protein